MSFLQTWEKARILASISLIENNIEGDPIPISIVNKVTTDINTPYERGHSINQYNSHVVEKPPEYSFTIAIAAISSEIAILRDIQSSGIYFNMTLRDENDDVGSGNMEYQLCREYFGYCKLTKRSLDINVGEVPMVVFDGIALEYTYSYWFDDNGEWKIVDLNHNGAKYWFGHGDPIPLTVPLYGSFKKVAS